MSYRSILVPLDGAPDNRAVLQNALGIARTFNAHVEVMHVRPDPRDAVPLFGEGLSGDMLEEMIAAADKDTQTTASAVRGLVDELCADAGLALQDKPGGGEDSVTIGWREAVGREDDIVSTRGRLSDLIVTASPTEEASPMRSLSLNAALFDCGRPVLVLPAAPQTHDVGRVVAIAWSGTAQGARAVQGALPIITRAAQVHVLTCESERTEKSAGEELAEYLAWWGVTPNVHTFPPGPDGVGQAILDKVADVGADLLISGAYSHSRLMQTVIGGVTSLLLDKASVPVLFSH